MPQSFGGPWTLLKLKIIEEYLNSYTIALKNKPYKLCYIDAFAGSGLVNIKGVGVVPGSALRALDYPFKKFIFIEKNKHYAAQLKKEILNRNRKAEVEIKVGDCNRELKTLLSYPWYTRSWRGVMFLDPYAMDLSWDSLSAIQKTRVFDVWYLFPISALCRVLQKNGQIPPKNREVINRLLGTNGWEKEIYFQSPQLSWFDQNDIERVAIGGIRNYVIKRLQTVFPAVSEKSLTLRNPRNNSPLFLLCFAVSNPSPRAIDLSLGVVNHLLTRTT